MMKIESKLWYLKQLDIFEGLPVEKIESISKVMSSKSVGRREIILSPEDRDKVFFLKSGAVELYYLSPEGKKVILDRLGPGSIFGDLDSREVGESFAEATTNAFICILTKEQFFDIVSKNPGLSTKIMKFFLTKLKQAEKTIGSLASDKLNYKFFFFFHRLAENHGIEDELIIRIKEKFTHEEFASMLGVSRQTMTNLINELERQGVLKRQHKQISFDKTKFRQKFF